MVSRYVASRPSTRSASRLGKRWPGGVEGSPTYFVDGQSYFCPSLQIDHEGDRLHISIDRPQMHRFLEAAFG